MPIAEYFHGYREFDEVDEYCPHCDNHFVIEAKEPVMMMGVEGEDPRMNRDWREKQFRMLEEDMMAERMG
jgi:dTDP-4-dehydrorhamnose 3,5-epimerase-like enzyme